MSAHYANISTEERYVGGRGGGRRRAGRRETRVGKRGRRKEPRGRAPFSPPSSISRRHGLETTHQHPHSLTQIYLHPVKPTHTQIYLGHTHTTRHGSSCPPCRRLLLGARIFSRSYQGSRGRRKSIATSYHAPISTSRHFKEAFRSSNSSKSTS